MFLQFFQICYWCSVNFVFDITLQKKTIGTKSGVLAGQNQNDRLIQKTSRLKSDKRLNPN